MKKHYAVQTCMITGDARKQKFNQVKSRPIKSVAKFTLNEEQIEWGIGHNMAWIMTLVKQEGTQ